MGPRKTRQIKTNCQLKFTNDVFDEPTPIKCEIAQVEGSRLFSVRLPGAETILTFSVADVLHVISGEKKGNRLNEKY
ncbi:hypothetical protein [Eubacterium callanderi]|uniref:hypothetical protein n=1 Tax=Eubacterium callanderi TaxID=53442 RepID=UPI002672E67F|nr:hypothetical protein [Eubacterium callanderi]